MCDYFWQRMENDRGDLADIVRSGSRSGPSNSEFDPPAVDEWQLQHPSKPVVFAARADQSGPAGDLGDSFVNIGDPLLNQYAGVELFDGAKAMAAPAKMAVGSKCSSGPVTLTGELEINRPFDIFSRVLQISPAGGSKHPSPLISPRLIKPSPIAAVEMMKASSSNNSSAIASGTADHGGGVPIPSPRTLGIKRRRSQAKKVVCIPAPVAAGSRSSGEIVPSDLWAWRKYGQKPIKGSPYPRGYYRCSSSKGCSARKQVERSRTDPNMLVVTYTSEHNHPWPTQRNALAGSSRSHASRNASKSSNTDNNNVLKSSPTALKDEHREATTTTTTSTAAAAAAHKQLVKEEDVVAEMDRKAIDQTAGEDDEFDQIIHQGYKPIMPEAEQPVDDDFFFAGLAELEADPVSLIFSRGFMEAKTEEERVEDKAAALDPFNMFDWAGRS